jgi:glycosyltransferase involved in cell wall biosynthesis
LKHVRHLGSYEIVFVGFYGFFLVPLVRIFYRRRLIFDAFVSTYDTLDSEDSKFKQLGPLGPVAQLLFGRRGLLPSTGKWIDRLACRLADETWIDTEAHRQYFIQTLGIPGEKITVKYVGADDIFKNASSLKPDPSSRDKFRVFYYGTGLKIHGIDVILTACKILEKHPEIEFLFGGPIQQRHGSLLAELDLKNAVFEEWIPYEDLPEKIAGSDLCLGGHFSDIDKANRVIAGKTFQFLAVGIPTIVGDNVANRELERFDNWGEIQDLITFCPVNDPSRLAAKICDRYMQWKK